MTCGKEDIPLDQVGLNFSGGEKIGGERERKAREKGGERSSTFSLNLTAIGPLTLVGARGKVRPLDEGFT